MNEPCALHLPGAFSPWSADRAPAFQAFATADAAMVWLQLEDAARAWSARPVTTRIEAVAAAAAELRRAGPGAHNAALAQSTGLSTAGVLAAWDATFAPCDAEALRAAVDAEDLWTRLAIEPTRRIVHVLSGNVLPASWSMLVRGWLVGAAQWVRPARREPLFAALIAHHLRRIAPELAAAVAITWWPHDDDALQSAVLGHADTVTAQGDDDSIAALAVVAARRAPNARFLGYGSRWSAALLSRAAQTPETAAALARDVALFDQQGCLSPSLVLVEDGPQLESWCDELAAELAASEHRCPRGPLEPRVQAGLRLWRESMQLSVALGRARRLWESNATTAWAVVLTTPENVEDSPLDRHVVVLPFSGHADVARVLGPRLQRLQGLAFAAPEWPEREISHWIDMLRPARVAAPGKLQWAPPVWRQDHLPPLASLLP